MAPEQTPASEIQSVEQENHPGWVWDGTAWIPSEPVEGAAEAQVTPADTEVAPPPPPPTPTGGGTQVAPPLQGGQPAPPAAPPASEPAAPVGASTPPPPPPPEPTALPPTPSAPETLAPSQPKVMDADWPHVGYTGPQPWEAENPPVLTQNHLMLSSGSAGEEVVELASYLAHLGYGTSISAGQNPHAIYDSGISDAVRAFCADYGVEEDPQVRRARTEDTCGPWLWEAIIRAAHKKIADEEA
jgi:hypothetical protein